MTNEQLVTKIQGGLDVKENMQQLYLQNKGMIYRTVKKYQNIDKMADIDDLMQQAYLGLVEAVDHYDSGKGVLFLSYATYWIGQSVKRYIETCGLAIHLPIHVQQNIYKYNQVTSSYLSQYNRIPEDKEYCRWLDITSDKLESLRQTMGIKNAVSIESPLGDGISLSDTIQDPIDDIKGVEYKIDRERLSYTLWDAVGKAVKNDKDMEVLKLRYKDGLTYKEAGEKLGVSGDMARQREVRSMRKLKSNRRIMEIGEEEGIISISKVRKERRQSSINYRSILNDMTDEEQESMRMLM